MSKKSIDSNFGTVIDKDFLKFAESEYYKYGVEVNEDRAIPSIVDGMKPVERRTLWAAFDAGITKKTKKSARIVGDCIGKFHPHGDSSVYQAMVVAINKPAPTFEGEGNFGNFSDLTPSAMRYTNAKISKYAMKTFFDPFYTPVIEKVPNFDDEETEPVILPALLPNLILNGTQGIGVGLDSRIPAFSYDSVLGVVQDIFSGKKLTAKNLAKKLKFVTQWDAIYDPEENKEQILNIMQEGVGRIMFKVDMKLNEKNKTIVATGFPQDSMEQVLETLYPESKGATNAKAKAAQKLKAKAIQNWMKRAYDASGKKDKNGTLLIELKPSFKKEDMERALVYFSDLLKKPKSFSINVTHRIKDKDEVKVSLESVSVLKILEVWSEYRVKLERTAAVYWQGRVQKRIEHNELMQLAFNNLDDLIKVIKQKHKTLDDLRKAVSKLLKITDEKSQIIIERKLYQLSGLEATQLKDQHKQLVSQLKDLQNRENNPEPYILDHLKTLKVKQTK